MKIFFLITGLGMGGAEQQVIGLADEMTKYKHEISICYITGDAKILPQNTSINIISLNAKKNFLSLLKAFLHLRKIIRTIKPTIIHSHMVHANLMARIVRPVLGFDTKLICTAHNKNEGGRLRMFAYRLTDFLADISTNVSDEAVEAFVRKKAVKRGKIITMYNGIDINKFVFDEQKRMLLREEFDIPMQTKVLIAVGRLTEAKDYPNLLQACAMLKDDYMLWIVGGGEESYKKYLEDIVCRLGISQKVFFLDIRNDIPSLFSAADVFILSSEWEGLPLVVAEAMSCERIVVATNSGGVKEMIGDCGYLVPIKNADILFANIKQAMELSKVEANILGKKARERAMQYFDLKHIVKLWLELYRDLLENKTL